MENKAIIHISDLHVTQYKKNNGKINDKIDSFLTTSDNSSKSALFISKLTEKIKKDYKDCEFYLVITGDITNSGERDEFAFAEKYIRNIIEELNINIKDCLIIPGDHDVHRTTLKAALSEYPTDTPHLLNKEKLFNFAQFYKKIKQTDFDPNSVIIDKICIDRKIALLGINSNFKIDDEGGDGFIDIYNLEKEFKQIKKEYDADINYVFCWHHNIVANYEDKNNGQWEKDNRDLLLTKLEQFNNVKLILMGNEHISGYKLIGRSECPIITSDAGTLSSIKDSANFKLYPIKINDSVILENKIYALHKDNGNDQPFYWSIVENKEIRQPDKFILYKKNTQEIKDGDVEEVPSAEIAAKESEKEIKKEELTERTFYYNPQISEKLYQIVKDKNLFHSGHFHWSETSRAHNWIDISKLLENKEDLLFAKNSIIDVIEQFNIQENCDLIVGLGYEGNIISSKASIKYNIPYTTLPYSYRYNEHNDFEKKINFENTGDFKHVLIITDVVNDGRTIRKLIAKREKKFFEKVNEITVISLFYTGIREIRHDILNSKSFPKDYDTENDHTVNNIKFYTVKSLRIERCPYKADYKESCFIYKDSLNCIHLFYTEK